MTIRVPRLAVATLLVFVEACASSPDHASSSGSSAGASGGSTSASSSSAGSGANGGSAPDAGNQDSGPPVPATIAIKPAAVSVAIGASSPFTATVQGLASTSVTWSVKEGATGGTISATGLYQAPMSAGTFHVIASSVAEPSLTASADVIVRAQPAVGVWTNVTPSNADLTSSLPCGNFGANAVSVDPVRPSDLYVQINCQGIWKSTDFGSTWTGPINTGMNGPAMAGAGGITIPSASTASPALIYAANIRDPGTGFWRSTDGGVSWTQYNVGPGGSRQDFYAPSADPYDAKHLIMTGHEMNLFVESVDGGETWTTINTDPGMTQQGGTGLSTFVDTGDPTTTRKTILWLAQQSGGGIGTWRTADGGASWTKVDDNEHPHGNSQFYQPGQGVVYMGGAYSALGWGVLRSSDYGVTWTHVGGTGNESNVFGTPKNVYAMYGWAIGVGQMVDVALESAPPPGTGTWASSPQPAGMTQGPNAVAVTSDGTHSIIVTSNYNGGVWLYVEP